MIDPRRPMRPHIGFAIGAAALALGAAWGWALGAMLDWVGP